MDWLHRVPRLVFVGVRRYLRSLRRDNIFFLASALSFDALLAAIPFTLLFLTTLATVVDMLGRTAGGIGPLLQQVLPLHGPAAEDPLGRAERIIRSVIDSRAQLSRYAVPLFLLFSTRLFASLRVALNQLFELPAHKSFFAGLAKDAMLVLMTTVLFVANSLITLPVFGSSAIDGLVAQLLALSFGLVLFFLVYSLASDYPMRWDTALIAAIVASVGFEAGKLLYSIYLRQFLNINRVISHANAIALLLFVIWIYYTAMVFLMGGQVAKLHIHVLRSRERQA